MAKIILFIATSLDGFIADEKGNVDWLPQPTSQENCGYSLLMQQISAIIMGRNSYEQIIGFGEWAWSDKQTYVFTHQPLPKVHENIHFVDQDVSLFAQNLKAKKPDQDMWLLGGAQLAKSFADARLIDECIITIIPVSLGRGIKLELSYNDFKLVQTITYEDGIIQKKYKKK